MFEDFSPADWTSVGVAAATLCLAVYTARMANATKRMARASEEQLSYLRAQVAATERGVEIQQRGVELASSPRLKLVRQGGGAGVRFDPANLDGGGGGRPDDALTAYFKNVGGATATDLNARALLPDGKEFLPSFDLLDVPTGNTNVISIVFLVPGELLRNGEIVVLQVDYENPKGEVERVDVRVAPDVGLSKWSIMQSEKYGPPS
jgi:hypothetical protein